jgi:hypothetical protein
MFRRRDYREKKCHNPEKVSWVLALVKVVSLAPQIRLIKAGNPTPSIAK